MTEVVYCHELVDEGGEVSEFKLQGGNSEKDDSWEGLL